MANTPKIRFKGFTEDWEQRKLENVVEFLDTLRKPLEGAKRVSGPYPYYGASGIVDYVDGYIFDEELILLSEDGANITDRNYPVCFLASGKYWVNNHAHVLKCKDGHENNFICNSLERKDYKQYNSGMAMPKLNQEVCRGIPVSCPKYEEQKKIGDYFRSLDNLITLHQRKCDETKELKKYMLQKMFPKNGERVPEIRFAGFTDDWEQRKLEKHIIEYHEVTTENNQYPVLTSSRKGIFLQTDYYSGNQVASADNTGYNIVPYGYFTYRHMSDDEIFHFNINDIVENGIVSTLYPVFTTDEKLDSRYLQYQLNYGSEFARFAVLQKQGGSRTYMYLNKLKKLSLTMPTSIDEQKKISSFLMRLDNLITLHQRKCDDLKEVKKYMLQNMFPAK